MKASKRHPGVSGKSQSGREWINEEELSQQHEFADEVYESEKGFEAAGTGKNLFGRSDLSEQQEELGENLDEAQILETLKRSPEIDLEGIHLEFNNGSVLLEGEVDEPARIRTFENIVKNIPGVSEVINRLEYRSME